MTRQTWFCAQCGSTDIRHDAIVQWDAENESWTVLETLEDSWCENCQENHQHPGEPAFGTHSD